MKAHKLVNGTFVEVDDPAYDPQVDDVRESIANAGYRSEISTRSEDGVGAEVEVYVRDEVPRYYIDIMGASSCIGAVVADDFPSFVQTLKELHPLLTLVGLDQVNSMRIDAQLERERAAGALR